MSLDISNRTAPKSVGPLALGAALLAAPSIALAHETGAPHGVVEHMALYASAAALLVAGLAAVKSLTARRVERRVRVRVDERRR